MPEMKAMEFTDRLNLQPFTETTNVWAARVTRIDPIGHAFLRYGLVVAIGWIAAMEVTEYEAKGIQPLPSLHKFLRDSFN